MYLAGGIFLKLGPAGEQARPSGTVTSVRCCGTMCTVKLADRIAPSACCGIAPSLLPPSCIVPFLSSQDLSVSSRLARCPVLLLRRAKAAGVEIRALLITSPHNPTGRLYSPKALLAAVAWGRKRGLHIIVDEVHNAMD